MLTFTQRSTRISNFPFLALFILFFTSSLWASDEAEIYKSFVIKRGFVTITPSFCPPDQCEVQRAQLSGQFVARILPSTITFTDSFLSNSKNLSFQLPNNPNLDAGGTTRRLIFRLRGKNLWVRGQINSSAFDGPVIDYQFIAKMQKGTPAQATTAYYELENKGLLCITTPCFSYAVRLLNDSLLVKNTVKEIEISRVDFPEDSALAEQVFQAQSRLAEGERLVILGRIETYQGFSGTGRALRIKDWFISGRK